MIAMFGKGWRTSERRYEVLSEVVDFPLGDGTTINASVFRPDSGEKFPAVLGIHAYPRIDQTAPIKPKSFSSIAFLHPNEDKGRGWLEAGDPNFYARRGYVQVIANVRGTGMSGGQFHLLGEQEARDTGEVIQWIAEQPWCNGK